METFTPEPETLPDYSELEAIASDIDIERSANLWRDNPPDPDYDGILDASPDEGDDDG